MPKNIVICSDGTGNTGIKGRGTNVFKLYEAIDLHGHRANRTLLEQIAIYDDGVGTEDFKPAKIFSGMTGWGLSRNVKQLYKELVRVYKPGDNLYLFGFSRFHYLIHGNSVLDWGQPLSFRLQPGRVHRTHAGRIHCNLRCPRRLQAQDSKRP